MMNRFLYPKRILRTVLFTLLLSVAGVTNVFAQTFTQGNLNYSINSDGATVTVTGHVDGQNATGELVIPESVELYGTTYPVTVIGNSAFQYCSGLTGSLVIPNSVSSIGNYAFYGCTGFTGSLTIGNSVATIGEGAFYDCNGFTGSLVIPNSVITIGGSAFSNCCGFTSLTLGNSVQTIKQYAFYNCNGFTGALNIPESVTQINNSAFGACYGFTTLNYNAINCNLYGSNWGDEHWLEYCSSMTIVNIGESVQIIPSFFLKGRTTFVGELVIPESVTTIKNDAFYGCTGFSESLNIGNSVTSIGNYAFNGCNGFTGTLTIGNSVTTIGENAFDGCTGFTGSLTIPNSVSSIGTNAFSGCTSFSGTLTLGSSVAEIGNTAFFGACEGFTSFVVLPEAPPTLGNNVFVSADYSIPVSVPCGSLDAYQNAEGWNVFANLQEFNPCQWIITADVSPASGGTISGVGTYEQGQTCTLVANPNEDFSFVNWTEDGVEVSADAAYTFTVTASRHLVANFQIDNLIGEGTATSSNLPSYSYYPYSLTQQIYTAEEIGQMGVIRSVAFFNAGSQKNRNYDIYLAHTEKSSFNGSNDWVAVTNTDKVFSGNVNMLSNDWTIINFDTPFAYNGTSNIVLVVDDNTGEWNSGLACRVFNAQSQAIRIYGDGTNFNPNSPSGYSGYVVNVKNQIALGFSSTNAAVFATVSPEGTGTVSGEGVYQLGETCTLMATPNSDDYVFVNWTENGEVVSNNSQYSFTVMGNRQFVANFLQFRVDITASANPEEGGTITGTGNYLLGQTCTLTATPSEDYAFVNWTEDDEEVSTEASYSFTVTGNRNLVANFRNIRYNIWVTVQPEEGGTVSVANTDRGGWMYYDNGVYGTSIGSGGGVVYWGTMFPASIITENRLTKVALYENSYNISPITVHIYQGGTTAPNTEIYTQTVNPVGGDAFHEIVLSSHVTIDPSQNLWVVFEENGDYPANACADGGHSNNRWVSLNGIDWSDVADLGVSGYEWMIRAYVENVDNGDDNNDDDFLIGSYLEGETCTLTATPNENFFFVNWTENGQEVSTDATYSFTVSGDRNLVANFTDPIGVVHVDYYPDVMNPGSPYVRVTWGGGGIIGDIASTTITPYTPFYTLYNYSISEALYTAAELLEAGVTTGQMTSLSWEAVEVTTNQTQNNISIWMANVPDSELTTTSHLASNMTLVYSGNIGIPTLGWNEFVFNEGRFAWDGHSNVLVLVQRNNGQWNGHVNWHSHNAGFNGMSYKYQDNTPYNVMANTYGVTCSTNRPNIMFKGVGIASGNYVYKLYRKECDGTDYLLVADSVSGYYVDSSWLQLPLGTYQYGVSATRNDGSEGNTVASNCIERGYYTYQITATPNIEGRGWVNGTGEIALGANCTLIAMPFGNNTFTCWKENGTVVSTDTNYSFIVTEPRSLVAVFSVSPEDVIVFADYNVKSLCVNNWDIDGDGELAYDEAATVTDLGNVFLNHSEIVSFDELQYFTGLTSIGYSAFYECSSLTSIVIPEGVTVIDSYAFYDCYNLVSVNIPDGVVWIGEYAFYVCGLLGELTLPEPLEYVGEYAFFGCDGITTVNYNAVNCQTMGSAAAPVFYDCAFTHLNIGENVQNIPNFAFKRCFMITDMTVAVVNPPTIYPGTFGMVSRSIPVSVPYGSGDIYRNTQYWEEFFNIIEVYFNDVQIVQLSQGPNWFSTYLEITKEDLQNALLAALSNPTGAIIKSQDGNSTYRSGRWRDQNFVWDVAKMYMIVAPEDCVITLTGMPINPAEHPITIAPNAPTWIGFPFAESKTPAQVIPAGFAVNGDIIKGMGGNIRYNNGSWRAQGMNSLEPGKGYIYNSKSAVSRTLIFPTSAK